MLLGETKQVIMLQNIRSLTKNFDELTLEIASLKEKPIAICLTETWLKDEFSSNIFHIDGYDELVTSNREKRGGGVAIFVQNKFNVKIRGSLNLNNIQAVSVYFSIGTKKLSMTCVYIPPNATTIATFDVLSTYLEQHISDPQSLHVLCGDFNVSFLSKGNKKSYLREMTQTFDLKLVSENLITRETKNSSSYIDLFFTNFESEVTSQRTKITDHYSLLLKLKNKTNLETENNFFQSRNWAKLENPLLQEKISFVLWQRLKQIDSTEKEINDEFKCSQRTVQEALDHYLPKTTRKHVQKIWIDNEVKNAAEKKKCCGRMHSKLNQYRPVTNTNNSAGR